MRDTNREAMAVLATALHKTLALIVGHPCEFVLVAFPQGHADWVTSTQAGNTMAPLRDMYRAWLARFVDDGPFTRAGFPDEAALASTMRKLADAVAEMLQEMTGQNRFALVIFPRDVGMYCANITRDTAKNAMVELLEHLERAP